MKSLYSTLSAGFLTVFTLQINQDDLVRNPLRMHDGCFSWRQVIMLMSAALVISKDEVDTFWCCSANDNFVEHIKTTDENQPGNVGSK